MAASLACGLQNFFRHQPIENTFSDFTVIVEGTPFLCHKVILNACSEYFEGLFRSNMRESQENRVELQGMKKETFATILELLYKGSGALTLENVFDVWDATLKLQIGYLIDECESFVNKSMTSDNCFSLYELASMYSATTVFDYFLKFVSRSLEDLRKTDNFLKLPFPEFYRVIDSNELIATSEDVVLETVFDWIEYVPDNTEDDKAENENRQQYIVPLLSAVRLCLVSRNGLKHLSNHDLVIRNREVRDLIFDAVDYHLNVHRRHDAWPDIAIHRAGSVMKHAVVFVDDGKLMAYLLDAQSLHEYAHVSFPNATMVSLAVFDNMLYIDNPNALRRFTLEKTWEVVIKHPPRHLLHVNTHTLLPHGDYIYRFSPMMGLLKRCNVIPGHAKKWELGVFGTLGGDAIVRYKRFILMFSADFGSAQTECFDTITKTFETLSPNHPIGGPLNNLLSFSSHGVVYILQRNGFLRKIISTDTITADFPVVTQLWDLDYDICGALIYRKKLFVFGNQSFGDITDKTLVTSVPGVFDSLKIVGVDCQTECVPMILKWLQ